MVCRGCGCAASLIWRARDENRKTSPCAFDYWRCSRCGLVFLANIPEDLDRYYGESYHAYPSLRRLRRNASRERYKVDLVKCFVAGGRLLEIGSSYGSFAFEAKRAGFDVEVIEQDERCREYLRDVVQVGVRDIQGPADAGWPVERYDVVALWQVLEHLTDPWSYLRRVAESLRPGGIAVIATPNPDSFQARLLGERWPHVDAPRHIHLFPVRCLCESVARQGLEAVSVLHNDKGGRGWNRFGWERLIANRLPGQLGALAGLVLGGLVCVAVSPWERRKSRGAAYTVVFRKPAAA